MAWTSSSPQTTPSRTCSPSSRMCYCDAGVNVSLADGYHSAHCFERSALRSFSYILMDVAIISSLVYGVLTLDTYISPKYIDLPHPALYRLAQFCLWTLYGFMTGLPATGLWVIAHECGHQAFSPSKTINNTVGWVLHSA